MYYITGLIIIIIFLIFLITYFKRKKQAIIKVKHTSKEDKISYINTILNPFGFEFDAYQDIVVSLNDSWQREVGYCDLYDLKAPFLNMVFDAQPIYFDYNNKHYRVELWKGQYGITTGAEIGIYIRDSNSDFKKEFYRTATYEESLELNFKLLNNCSLLERCAYTWWSTGFDVGEFSRPKDLSMKVCIKFPNEKMQYEFLKGLLNAGYTKNKICICQNYICFDFCKPYNYKLNNKYKLIKYFIQIINYINCSIYMHLTKPFVTTLDKLTYLRFMAPTVYKLILGLSIPRKKHKKYLKKIRSH